MAQRLVRAKQKISGARIPYRVPDEEDLPERLEAVMAVIYLVFNEGYAATSGDALVRPRAGRRGDRAGPLAGRALARPAPRAPLGADAAARLAARGARDRRGRHGAARGSGPPRWDQARDRRGAGPGRGGPARGPAGAYAIQAAIAALHARAARAADTDWPQIAALYARLFALHPSPIVMLNHAVAVAMADGPAGGLRLLDQLVERQLLPGYHLLPAARADLLRRLGRRDEAAQAYSEALTLVGNEAERRFLERRLAEVQEPPP
jgi:RNA polymerase sigma-70 factor (ECF subfamily)